MRIVFCIFLICLNIFSNNLARAESAPQAAQEIYYGILSPFCPGRALADCPSEKASALKDRIKAELDAGKSKDAVFDEIIKEYGEQYRAVPNMQGLNSLAWIIPLVIITIGLLVVVCKIRSKGEDKIIED